MEGPFRFNWKKPERRALSPQPRPGRQRRQRLGDLQATCPFHAQEGRGKKKALVCTLTLTLQEGTAEGFARLQAMLRWWCLQHAQCSRKRAHNALRPRGVVLPDWNVLRAQVAATAPPAGVVLTDEALDAAAGGAADERAPAAPAAGSEGSSSSSSSSSSSADERAPAAPAASSGGGDPSDGDRGSGGSSSGSD
jgi:hypothetical protein